MKYNNKIMHPQNINLKYQNLINLIDFKEEHSANIEPMLNNKGVLKLDKSTYSKELHFSNIRPISNTEEESKLEKSIYSKELHP